MLINTKIANQKFIPFQSFGQGSKPDFLLSQNTSSNPVKDETNLNNTPSVQNKVIVQTKSPEYKEIKTFNVPNIGKGRIFELKNGHKVVILPKAGRTAIYTTVRTGTLEAPKGKEEINHYLEHMIAGQFLLKKEGIESNAQTDNVSTDYYAVAPVQNPKELEKLIRLHAENLKYPYNQPERIEAERKIITKEIDTMYQFENKEENLMYNNLFNTEAFTPTSKETRKKSLQNISESDLIDKYKTYYVPSNMTTTIVGNVDFNETMKIMNKYFGADNMSEKPLPIKNTDLSVNLQNSKRIDILENRNSTHISFVGPDKPTPKEVLMETLMKSIFAEKLNEIKPETWGNFSVIRLGEPGNNKRVIEIETFCITEDEKERKDNLKKTYAVIFDLSQNSVPEKTLQKAKEIFKNGKNEEQQDSFELAENLNHNVFSDNDVKEFDDYEKQLDAITSEDIQDFTKKYMDLNKASIVEVHAEEKQNTKVSFKGSIDNNLNVEEYILPNNVYVAVDHSSDISRTGIGLNLKFESSNPAMVKLLSRIISNKDCDEFRKTLDENGLGDFHIQADGNQIKAVIECVPEKTPLALKILKEKVFDTKITEEDFNHEKQDLLEYYKSDKKDAWSMANKKLDSSDISNEEMIKYLEIVKLEDIKNAQKQVAQTKLVLTIPENTYKKDKNILLDYIANNFPKSSGIKEVYAKISAKAADLSKSEIFFEESNDTKVYKQYKTPQCTNIKDQISRDLLKLVLQERLFQDLREKQNICYTVTVNHFETENDKGVMEFNIKTTPDNPENIKKSIEGFDNHSKQLTQILIPNEELERAKTALKNEEMKRFETSGSRSWAILWSLESPYGTKKFNESLKTIDEIKPEHIQKMAQLIFEKPSITILETDKKTFDDNKKYFESKGEVSVFEPKKD